MENLKEALEERSSFSGRARSVLRGVLGSNQAENETYNHVLQCHADWQFELKGMGRDAKKLS